MNDVKIYAFKNIGLCILSCTSTANRAYDLTVSGQVVTDCHISVSVLQQSPDPRNSWNRSVVCVRMRARARSYDCDLETWILCF